MANVIERGQKEVSVLTAEEKWYGVTYKEDKPVVVEAIGKKIKDGEYIGI